MRAGIESPIIDARLLLQIATGFDRVTILRGLDSPLSADHHAKFEEILTRRIQREPLAYIRGTQEFYGREFQVSSSVLIPRPETELLVDFAKGKLRDFPSQTVLDIGTGSGCIGISVALEVKGCRVICIDISPAALIVARQNGSLLGEETCCDFLLENGLTNRLANTADIILTNPPYIREGEIDLLQPEVSLFEPRLALSGGDDSYRIIREFVRDAAVVLKSGGWLAMEIGIGQAETVQNLIKDAGFNHTEVEPDLAGIPRMAVGQIMKLEVTNV